jgi:hypothetical protein
MSQREPPSEGHDKGAGDAAPTRMDKFRSLLSGLLNVPLADTKEVERSERVERKAIAAETAKRKR